MRLFLALPLPDGPRRDLAALCHGVPGARWARPENLHLTLRFLGETDRHQAADLDGLLADIRAPAFEMTIRGVGAFTSKGRMRALWAGVAPEGALMHLQAKLERACMRAGFSPDGRKFSPHITLARFKDAREHVAGGFLEHHGNLALPPFAVDGFTLFESHMGHGGSHYVPLRVYPLIDVTGGALGEDYGDDWDDETLEDEAF